MAKKKWVRIARIPSTKPGGWRIADYKVENNVVKALYVKSR